MRTIFPCALLTATATILITLPVRAGVHSTSEKYPLGNSYLEFRSVQTEIRRIAITEIDAGFKKIPIETPERKRALLMQDLLAGIDPFAFRRGKVKLTEDQYLNISAYLIRLGKHDEAINLLQPVISEYPDNFLLPSNLGTAYFLKVLQGSQDLQSRAQGYLQMAKSRWPEKFSELSPEQKKYFKLANWNEETFDWYRKVEEYQYRLATKGMDVDIPDIAGVLFPDRDGKPQKIKFVGDKGKYIAGEISLAEKKKLPSNALKVAKQLAIWFPKEQRIRWLVAELFNARGFEGDVEGAAQIMKDLVINFRNRNDSVVEHYHILKAYKAPKTTPKDDTARFSMWQLLGVGFLTGAVITLFATWQVRMLTRRR